MDPLLVASVVFLVLASITILFYVLFIWKRNHETKPTKFILYAKAGEIVTCLNGHEICDVAKDIFVADLISINQFENWRHQPQPVPHDTIKPCMTCGAPYIKSDMPYGGTRLHINGKWRTTHGY
jgi:hypothetical protein